MLRSVFTNITEGSLYCGLEITETAQGETYFFLQLKKSKQELSIAKSMVLNTLEEVVQQLNNNAPLFVCINTTGVLSKQLEQVPSAQDAALVNEAFPNLDTGNIYWELTQKSSRPIVSIARKEYVDTLLKKLEEFKIIPFNASLGISCLNSVTPYLNEKRIRLSKYSIELDESSNISIAQVSEQPEPEYHIINGLSISNAHILGFAQILGHLNPIERISNLTELNAEFTSALNNQRLFHMVGRTSLLFFIILLLINFLFFNHYFQKVDGLTVESLANGSKKEELIRLSDTVQKKQERVELFATTTNSTVTKYLDKLAQQVPESIVLDQMNFQPLEKTVQDSKPIVLRRGVVLVSGVSKDINDFSKWLERLEGSDWIRSVETLEYDYLTKGSSLFLLEITCHED